MAEHGRAPQRIELRRFNGHARVRRSGCFARSRRDICRCGEPPARAEPPAANQRARARVCIRHSDASGADGRSGHRSRHEFLCRVPRVEVSQQYANLHDPPLPQEEAAAAELRDRISAPTLQAYVDTRARNLAVDLYVAQLVASGTLERAVLGQDDAGPVGLHLKDVRALKDASAAAGTGQRLSIEPGADELGMALTARALARQIHWTPRIAVVYSTLNGAAFNDPLEFAPVSAAIGGLIDLAGGSVVQDAPDITLFVRVPNTGAAEDAALLASIQSAQAAGQPVALADLTFLEKGFASQARFAKALLDFGSCVCIWTRMRPGTPTRTPSAPPSPKQLPPAPVGARIVTTRWRTPNLRSTGWWTTTLFTTAYGGPRCLARSAQHPDHTYLLNDMAMQAGDRNNALLWNEAASLLTQLYPQ